MFCAELRFADLAAPTRHADGGIFLGGSWIRPYVHRLLRTIICEGDGWLTITAMERFADDDTGIAFTRLDEPVPPPLPDHPLDWSRLTIDRRGQSVSYAVSTVHSAPVFMAGDRESVALGWNCQALLASPTAPINWDAALNHIAGASRYTPKTMVAGLYRSTAGATLQADASGIRYILPDAVPPFRIREPEAGTDPVGLLIEAVTALLAARPLQRERTAIELSGGMDSALTALIAAQVLGEGLLATGAEFDGAMGASQRARRATLRQCGQFDDLVLPAGRFAPFAPSSERRLPRAIWPEDESYPEMFEAMFGLLETAGIDTLISGFGGDELYPAYVGEEADGPGGQDDETGYLTPAGAILAGRAGAFCYPTGPLQPSCWQAAASRTQRLLRHGIWPVYPYHDSRLARFVASLPYEFRRDRMLLRQALTRLLGAPLFEGDYVKERFGPVAVRGVAENRDWLIALVKGSDLTASPYLDRGRILTDLAADPATLSRDRFGALFRLLGLLCFFQKRG